MSLGKLLLAVWLILVNIGQWFLDWVQYGDTGIVVVGLVGFVSGILLILEGLGVWGYKVN